MPRFLTSWLTATPLDRVAAASIYLKAEDEGARALAAYDRWLEIMLDPQDRATLRLLDRTTRRSSSLFNKIEDIGREAEDPAGLAADVGAARATAARGVRVGCPARRARLSSQSSLNVDIATVGTARDAWTAVKLWPTRALWSHRQRGRLGLRHWAASRHSHEPYATGYAHVGTVGVRNRLTARSTAPSRRRRRTSRTRAGRKTLSIDRPSTSESFDRSRPQQPAEHV